MNRCSHMAERFLNALPSIASAFSKRPSVIKLKPLQYALMERFICIYRHGSGKTDVSLAAYCKLCSEARLRLIFGGHLRSCSYYVSHDALVADQISRFALYH